LQVFSKFSVDRKVYVKTEKVEREIKAIADSIADTADVITFSGMGEPTLGANREGTTAG
jgi:wyosine [tRNA(Phe)-imidazoG37] synthetase (radical SAM superfamily)